MKKNAKNISTSLSSTLHTSYGMWYALADRMGDFYILATQISRNTLIAEETRTMPLGLEKVPARTHLLLGGCKSWQPSLAAETTSGLLGLTVLPKLVYRQSEQHIGKQRILLFHRKRREHITIR